LYITFDNDKDTVYIAKIEESIFEPLNTIKIVVGKDTTGVNLGGNGYLKDIKACVGCSINTV
jgi:hypothetical protein